MIVTLLHRLSLAVLGAFGLFGLAGFMVTGPFDDWFDIVPFLWITASLAAPVLGLVRARRRARDIPVTLFDPR